MWAQLANGGLDGSDRPLKMHPGSRMSHMVLDAAAAVPAAAAAR